MNKRDLTLPSAPWPYAVVARVNPKGRTGTFWCVVNLSKGHDVRVGPMVKGQEAAQWAHDWAARLYAQRLGALYGSANYMKVTAMRARVASLKGTYGWEVIR